jgi:nitroreductase
VPRDIIEHCLGAAGSAPSGANRQPWHFVVVSDAEVKRRIREAAEAEEHEFYTRRATPEWLEALVPLGTNAHKPFLEIAPWLIAIFAQSDTVSPNGRRLRNSCVRVGRHRHGVLIAAPTVPDACLTTPPVDGLPE